MAQIYGTVTVMTQIYGTVTVVAQVRSFPQNQLFVQFRSVDLSTEYRVLFFD